MFLQITIPHTDTFIQEILIARMEDIGYDGFQQEGSNLYAFINKDQFNAPYLEELLSPHALSWSSLELPDKNWNEEWEKNFQPVIVGTFCAIRASFHVPIRDVLHQLVITPKMSFGTGHHATTYMMIQAMESLDLKGKRVLDFGTGTGVLAILAERLGSTDILAIDNDEWSIRNTAENITENAAVAIRVEKMETLPANGQFDVILANINRHIILKELPGMGQQLRKDGVILLSGLLEDDFQIIEKEALKNELPISGRLTKNGWICLKVTRESK